jgi:hypothetical protein
VGRGARAPAARPPGPRRPHLALGLDAVEPQAQLAALAVAVGQKHALGGDRRVRRGALDERVARAVGGHRAALRHQEAPLALPAQGLHPAGAPPARAGRAGVQLRPVLPTRGAPRLGRRSMIVLALKRLMGGALGRGSVGGAPAGRGALALPKTGDAAALCSGIKAPADRGRPRGREGGAGRPLVGGSARSCCPGAAARTPAPAEARPAPPGRQWGQAQAGIVGPRVRCL